MSAKPIDDAKEIDSIARQVLAEAFERGRAAGFAEGVEAAARLVGDAGMASRHISDAIRALSPGDVVVVERAVLERVREALDELLRPRGVAIVVGATDRECYAAALAALEGIISTKEK